MNITDVVNDIKLTQGLNSIALPYNQPVENVIQEILKTTVREFSDIKPYVREGIVMKSNLVSPNDTTKNMDIYLIPTELLITRVKTASAEMIGTGPSQSYDSSSMSPFTVISPFVGFGSYYPQDIIGGVMTGSAINKFVGITSNAPTSKYLGYNKIQLFNFPQECAIKFSVKCEHDPSLETIEDSYYTSFVELATLDVQRTLYANLKNMQNVGSAFKEIQLKIEEWSGAEAAQKELIKTWKQTFHLDELNLVQFF